MQLPKAKMHDGTFTYMNDGLIQLNNLNKIVEERENNASSPLLSYLRTDYGSAQKNQPLTMKLKNDSKLAKNLFSEDIDVQHINASRVQTSYLDEETCKN